MNQPRKVEHEAFDEATAFEALLNRHESLFMNWLLSKLIKRPEFCRVVADLVRRAEQN